MPNIGLGLAAAAAVLMERNGPLTREEVSDDSPARQLQARDDHDDRLSRIPPHHVINAALIKSDAAKLKRLQAEEAARQLAAKARNRPDIVQGPPTRQQLRKAARDAEKSRRAAANKQMRDARATEMKHRSERLLGE